MAVSRVRCLLAILALAALAVPSLGNAQTPDCAGCGGSQYGVVVYPKGTTSNRTALDTGKVETFTVTNTGQLNDSYTLGCTGYSCTLQSAWPNPIVAGSIAINAGAVDTVAVRYNVGPADTGSVKLTAWSNTDDPTSDMGWYHIVATGAGVPILSMAPYTSTLRDVSKCLAACFDAVYSHSSASYTSLGTPRAVTLNYNSSTHKPTPVVVVNVKHNAQTTVNPSSYSIQLKLDSTGTFLTLLNGANIAYSSTGTTVSDTARLAAVFDARANGLKTGAYPIHVIVTSIYTSPSASEVSSAATTVLVEDESGSAYGVGFNIAGLQRVYPQTNGNALITEGDGSMALYGSLGSGNYLTPSGVTAGLTYNSGTTKYRRQYLDSSWVEFDVHGWMTKAVDRFGNTTTIRRNNSTDSLVRAIVDPMGKFDSLVYTSNKLSAIRVLPAALFTRTTTVLLSSGFVVKITDPDGSSDSLAYNGAGLLSRVYDRAGQRTDLVYDALNRVVADSAPSITLYDGTTGRPVVRSRPLEEAVWRPDSAGTTSSNKKPHIRPDTVTALVIGPVSDTTRYKLDPFGNPTRITDPYGAVTAIARDSYSRPTQVVQPNGHTVNYTYTFGGTGYLLAQTFDQTLNQTITYSYTGNDLAFISGNTVRTDYYYYTGGGSGGPARALKWVFRGVTAPTYPDTTGGTRIEWHRPDGMGRDTAVVDKMGHTVHNLYDGTWGSLKQVTDPKGRVSKVHLDLYGRPDTTWDARGDRTVMFYNSFNQVDSIIDPLSHTTRSYYDPATRLLTRLRDANGKDYNFAYNPLGALVVRKDLGDSSRVDSLGYDLAGNLRRVKNRKGEVLSMTYDKVGRLLTRSGPNFPTDTYRYDTLTAKWTVGVNSNAYDSVATNAAGQVTASKDSMGGKAYTGTYLYDSFRRLQSKSLTAQGGYSTSLNLTYGGLGTLDVACQGLDCVIFQDRNDDQQPRALVFQGSGGHSWTVTQAFDSTHHLTSQTWPTLLNAFNLTLKYDSLDRLQTRTSPKGGPYTSRLFTYDSLGWLRNACDSTGTVCTNVNGTNNTDAWSYDSTGNRRVTGSTVLYGAGNRLAKVGTDTLVYDPSGNLICRGFYPCSGGARTYQWDGLGRLDSVLTTGTTPTLVAAYRYDAFGRRILSHTGAGQATRFVYLDGQVVLDVDSATGSVKREYTWYPGGDQLLAVRDSTAHKAVAITDPINGTVRGLAGWGANGFKNDTLLKDYPEYPWGDATADTGWANPYRFTGARLDAETGFYYMRARYYDPGAGRFVSEDPIGIEGGLNLYAYSSNDPIDFSDPFGTSEDCPGKGGGGPVYAASDGGGGDDPFCPVIRPSTPQPVPPPPPDPPGKGPLVPLPLPAMPWTPNPIPGTEAGSKGGAEGPPGKAPQNEEISLLLGPNEFLDGCPSTKRGVGGKPVPIRFNSNSMIFFGPVPLPMVTHYALYKVRDRGSLFGVPSATYGGTVRVGGSPEYQVFGTVNCADGSGHFEGFLPTE